MICHAGPWPRMPAPPGDTLNKTNSKKGKRSTQGCRKTPHMQGGGVEVMVRGMVGDPAAWQQRLLAT